MKDVTETYTTLQAADHKTYYKHVYLYRREWDGGNYVLSAALDIDEYVITVGRITAQQDLILGEWKTENLLITVYNQDRIWMRSKTGGIWDGYIPEYSEIEIEMGYLDAGDVEHGIVIYRGVLTFDAIDENVDSDKATLRVRGFNEILQNKSAEEIPDNNITGETLTNAGDDLNYTTTNDGVGIFIRVYIDGVVANAGVDYTESQLNDAGNPGKITFLLAQAGNTITADYVYWYQDKTIEYLVEELVESAGITSHEIQTVVFPGDVQNTETIDIKAEFDAGTKEGTFTKAATDELFADIYAEPTTSNSDRTATAVGVSGSKYGESLTIADVNGTLESGSFALRKFATNSNLALTYTLHADVAGEPGAILETKTDNVVVSASYQFYTISGFTTLLTVGTKYWVMLETDKTVYMGARINDSSYPGSNAAGFPGTWFIDIFAGAYVFIAKIKNTWMSDTIDGTAGLSSWNKIVEVVPQGRYKLYTRSQAADAGWPATFDVADWLEVGSGGIIQSANDRYLRMTIRFDSPEYTDSYSDESNADVFVVHYNTSAFEISLANFTGLTVLGAIRELAIYCDYEFGFKVDKTFFFRQKNLQTSTQLYLNGITKIDNFKIDWTRIKNDITATFGIYTIKMNPDTEGDASPTSTEKYGVLPFSISGGNILNDNDVNISTNIAEVWFERYKTEKYKVRFKVRIYGQIDLGDLVYLGYGIHLWLIHWDSVKWDSLKWGSGDLPYGLGPKVIKYSINPEIMIDGGMEIEAVEV